MTTLSQESFTVYERSIRLVAWPSWLIGGQSISGVLLDQFKRAFISVPLNIAEGAGKHSGEDQARSYAIARGSALECGACLDVIVAMELAGSAKMAESKEIMVEIVSMLSGLSPSRAPDRAHEDEAWYGEGGASVWLGFESRFTFNCGLRLELDEHDGFPTTMDEGFPSLSPTFPSASIREISG